MLKAKNLTQICQRIAELVKQAGGQQAFAQSIGASQSLVSRLVNGQQQPRPEILEAIADLPGVDRNQFLALANLPGGDDEAQVPIFHCLIEGLPASNNELRTSQSIAVPPTFFRRSLYAVRGKVCEPIRRDPDECLQPEDIVIIDSQATDAGNLQRLDGKLCAVVCEGDDRTIILRRVFTAFDASEKKWLLKSVNDGKFEKLIQEKRRRRDTREKDKRVITLDPPDERPSEKFVDLVIDVDTVVGVALQVIRNL